MHVGVALTSIGGSSEAPPPLSPVLPTLEASTGQASRHWLPTHTAPVEAHEPKQAQTRVTRGSAGSSPAGSSSGQGGEGNEAGPEAGLLAWQDGISSVRHGDGQCSAEQVGLSAPGVWQMWGWWRGWGWGWVAQSGRQLPPGGSPEGNGASYSKLSLK